jgi:hypothetical protein
LRKSTLIIALASAIVLLVLIGRFYISEADFNLGNPSWNGFSQLSGMSSRPLYSMSELDGLGAGDTLLIVSPGINYTPAEAGTVAKFLQSGGSVIVMDDFGEANSLLDALNSPITIYNVPVAEYENYHINHSLPVIKSFNPSAETANVSQLIMNHPASVNASGAAYVLASTSNRAWLDANNNGRLDGQEVMGTYDVAAIAEYGNGRLIVISDPDLCINSMLDLGDNRIFLSNILRGDIWIDVSHGRDLTPLGEVYYGMKYDPKMQISIVLLIFAGSYAYVCRRPLAGCVKRLMGREPGNR